MEAKKLRSLLQEKGVKQTFLATKLGVSKTMITQWVKGQRPIAEKHVSQLTKILE